MTGYLRGLMPGVGMLCFLLVVSGQNGLGFQRAPDDPTPSSGFVIPQKPESVLTPAEQKGEVLYANYCAICHGKTGNGDGFNSYSLSKPPRNFQDRGRMAALSDSQVQRAILEGGAALGESPQMPAWSGVLTQTEASELTDFIRTLAKENDGKK